MKDWVNLNPTYFELPIAEFRGNPLVEALQPPPGNKKEALARLVQKPHYHESELELPSCYRALLPARLLNFMFPTSQHFRLQSRIYSQILNGYRWRNPTTALGQRMLHGETKDGSACNEESGYAEGSNNVSDFSDNLLTRSPVARVPANISFLTGLSGMGKSTLIQAIMRGIGKPVIRHSNYNGESFTETQILYMMRNVPDQCSAKAVCKSFGDRADELIGRNLYAKLFSDKSMTRTHYVNALRKIIANHHIGALVIDEFQNISLAKSGGKNEFLALILNLREELGIPIILVGTYRAAAVLKDESSIARRLVEGGFHELKRPASAEDDDWLPLCKILWRYQWVQNPQKFEDEVAKVLFDCSQGITGIMINLFVTAQTHAIEEGIETITPDLIKDVYKDRFRPLHPIIDILSRNDLEELALYDDLYFRGIEQLKADPVQNRIETVRRDMDRKQKELLSKQEIPAGENQKRVTKSRDVRKDRILPETLHKTLLGEGQDSPFIGGQVA